jgi:hypothetical protein
MASREEKIRELYKFINVNYDKIIERLDVPNFANYWHLTDKTIAEHHELFFSSPSVKANVKSYRTRYGITETIKLCATYGYHPNNFDIDFKEDLKGIVALNIDDKGMAFILQHFHGEIDCQIILNLILTENYFDQKPEIKYPESLNYCIENGAQMEVAFINFLVTLKKNIQRMRAGAFLSHLRNINGIFADIDINELVKIYANNILYPHDFSGRNFTKWIDDRIDKFDFSDEAVIKFVLYASSQDFKFFHKILSLLTSSPFFETNKYWYYIVQSISELIIRAGDDHREFFDSFLPYGINFIEMFDNYIDGNGTLHPNCEEFYLKYYGQKLLTSLAEIKGLIKF